MKTVNFFKRSLCLALLAALTACATQTPYTAEEETADQKIKDQILENYKHEKYTFLGHVDVTVYKGTAILGGLVFEPADKDVALRDARKVEGVKEISDQIQIESNAY
ncbi:BON domain-containing protein [Ferrovum sp. PN-J185]|uniref:BON domain-containing protein n=1 Tax=Ferrovum sp. PN-J185 TaxID=1356306 RepID=UPI000794A094|nr:BON domain-containing protein [Ferrovum sp. PN-J185]KXW56539.1 BON domain protein [Ferrovum sp. PN-J185]MCC6068113.1 BON domain-containing protein [Ferrovum sp. PN-J185]MDE1891776.1 BON domain-containing protein [Betaproteobacteria bacterium]MDE2056378.1 BON domain-containing protein [Betaproteobacteria bacterium]